MNQSQSVATMGSRPTAWVSFSTTLRRSAATSSSSAGNGMREASALEIRAELIPPVCTQDYEDCVNDAVALNAPSRGLAETVRCRPSDRNAVGALRAFVHQLAQNNK